MWLHPLEGLYGKDHLNSAMGTKDYTKSLYNVNLEIRYFNFKQLILLYNKKKNIKSRHQV